MEFKITSALPTHAPYIADAIMAAVGEEICLDFAGNDAGRLPLVCDTFSRLAAMDDTQYSYRNTLVALAPDGEPAGLIICYDGADLHSLRERFVSVANEILDAGLDSSEMADETSPDEIYLDTLCVFAPYRRQGLAEKLIAAAAARHAASGKPLGLLVDYDNPGARRLYVRCGFESKGERPFAGVMMEHMQLGVK